MSAVFPVPAPVDPTLFVHCPQCGAVASVEWHATFARVQHLKVRCVHRHWFLLPSDLLTAYPKAA